MMKKYSRMISMALALMLTLSCMTLPAFAVGGMKNNLPPNIVDIMTPDDGFARGPNIPKEFWNFDNGSYTGTVAYLGLGNGVYTNFLFQPNKDGVLKYAVDFIGDQQLGRTYKYEIQIYLKEENRKTLVDTSGTISFSDSGADNSASFSGLDQHKSYYFKIVNRCENNGQFFTGDIIISK